MSVAKVIEITSQSTKSFDDAIRTGIAKAAKTVDNIRSAWVDGEEVLVSGGEVSGYQVRLKVTFLID